MKKLFCILITTILLLTSFTSALASNTKIKSNNGNGHSEVEIKDFIIIHNYVQWDNSELDTWIENNYKSKGVHYININNRDYILISSGKIYDSSCKIEVKKLSYVKNNRHTLYVDYKLDKSDKKQKSNYTYILLKLNSNFKFHDVKNLYYEENTDIDTDYDDSDEDKEDDDEDEDKDDNDDNEYGITHLDKNTIFTNYIPSNGTLKNWVLKYYKTKGIHYLNYNNSDYLIISAGKCTSSGYSINVDDIFFYNNLNENLYVRYSIVKPSSNTMTVNVTNYPYLFVKLNTNYKFKNIIDLNDNDITNYGIQNHLNNYVTFDNYIPTNYTLKNWVYKYYKSSGVHYINVNDEDYVLISTGKKTTTGYSIIIKDIYLYYDRDDILYIDYAIQSPTSNTRNLTVTNYPYTLIKLNTDYDFDKVNGSIKKIDKTDIYKNLTLNQLKNSYISSNDKNEKDEILNLLLNLISTFERNSLIQ